VQQAEHRLAVVILKDRLLFEQTLVDAAELFGIEGAVVDVAGRGVAVFAVSREAPERVEEVPVGEERLVKTLGFLDVEKVPVERGDSQHLAPVLVGEEAECGPKASPQVGMAVSAGASLGQAAEARDAVVVLVNAVGREQAALLGDHQEQQPVNEAEQLFVELTRREFAARDTLTDRCVLGVAQDGVGDEVHCLFDAVAQPLADAAPLLDAVLVPPLEPAGFGRSAGRGEAAAMQEAEEKGEIGKLAFSGEDGFEIELQVRLAAEQLGIAEQPQPSAVGDSAPKVLGTVQVLLDERVRAQARPARGGALIQILAGAHDVNRRGVRFGAGAVGDGETQAVCLGGPLLVTRVIPQAAQQRDHPLVTRKGGAGLAFGEFPGPLLKPLPESAGLGPDPGDPIQQVDSGIEAEIPRLLAGRFAGGDRLEQIGSEEAAFDAERGVLRAHWCTPLGRGINTSRPRRSGG